MSKQQLLHAGSVRLENGKYEGRVFPFSGPDAGTPLWCCGHQHDTANEASVCSHREKDYRTGKRERPLPNPQPGPTLLRFARSNLTHLMHPDIHDRPACGAIGGSQRSTTSGPLTRVSCGNCMNTLFFKDMAFEEGL